MIGECRGRVEILLVGGGVMWAGLFREVSVNGVYWTLNDLTSVLARFCEVFLKLSRNV